MTFKLFGNQGYLTADRRNVESILSTKFDDWSLGSRRPGLMPMLGEGIFTQDGQPWKHSRELLRRQFVRIHRQGCQIFDAHVEDLITQLRSTTGVVDLQPHFLRFTLATTTALIFGEPVISVPGEETDAFEKSFDYASYISAIRLRLADLQWIWKPTKYKKACSVIKEYAMKFVQLALKDMEENGEKAASERYAFIIDLYREMKDPSLVRDQLVHVLIAGRDTTACLLSWAFFLLIRHPRSLAKLRTEIQNATGGSNEMSRETINNMKYLRYVIYETSKTTFLPTGGGPHGKSPVFIPKGTGVGYSVYHMHRLKSLYGDDANEFRPERWLGEGLDGIGWGFMPFHGGPRICLGQEFALTEAKYAIIRVLQTFPGLRLPPDVSSVPPGQEKQALTIVVMSADGCKVLLEENEKEEHF
ncbi:Cytochrome P450 E-class CYP52 [Penicillium atrosanguineum]|uniref:Cytochrome P450 E-class CYP52 n=1 Tax=Penicillium atrosanguineum TaxID=1132637 RepID=A0A9W9U5B3_9EURO|nr:Cytochrome P450 E-class CYP52 [Penicillium atrosanguineum]